MTEKKIGVIKKARAVMRTIIHSEKLSKRFTGKNNFAWK